MYEVNRENIEEKNRILKQKIELLERERKKIQDNFEFKIPNYVLDEIIESKGRILKGNLNAIINLARVNDRLTLEEADILKEQFVFNNAN
ncbi:MAG: hypothetical protein J6J60_05790 [Clostridia bacterium]|nr:hypothetical protein [Clostridia bacterium]